MPPHQPLVGLKKFSFFAWLAWPQTKILPISVSQEGDYRLEPLCPAYHFILKIN
jgi:hypothetical protein